MGTRLPGIGTIFVSQTQTFKVLFAHFIFVTIQAPLFVGDTMKANVEVTMIDPVKPIATCSTICVNSSGKTLMEGHVQVMLPKELYAKWQEAQKKSTDTRTKAELLQALDKLNRGANYSFSISLF